MLLLTMTSSTYVALAGFALAFVFASLIFGVEMKAILNAGTRRDQALTRRPSPPEYRPSELSFWMSEKFLAVSAAVVAFAVVLLTK